MNFRVNQKVICVDVSPARGQEKIHVVLETLSLLRLREIYTIRSCDKWYGVRLEEIRLQIDPLGGEAGFYPWRFRPVKNTNIDIFLAMLKKTPQEHLQELEGFIIG